MASISLPPMDCFRQDFNQEKLKLAAVRLIRQELKHGQSLPFHQLCRNPIFQINQLAKEWILAPTSLLGPPMACSRDKRLHKMTFRNPSPPSIKRNPTAVAWPPQIPSGGWDWKGGGDGRVAWGGRWGVKRINGKTNRWDCQIHFNFQSHSLVIN